MLCLFMITDLEGQISHLGQGFGALYTAKSVSERVAVLLDSLKVCPPVSGEPPGLKIRHRE